MLVEETSIKDLVSEYKGFIDIQLAKLLKEHPCKEYSVSKVEESVSYSVNNGGKRLRAILAMISAEAVLQEEKSLAEQNPAHHLAMALELVHAGSLIHDDMPCMDDDDMRRGKASNHKVFGEANALLAGDFLLVHPLYLLNEIETTAELKLELIKDFNLAIQEMIIGQSLDLSIVENENVEANLVRRMEELKTGALIKLSVVGAAKIAKASQEQLDALELYAKNIGLAFQVVDDILDLTQTSEDLGKTAAKDLAQNKQTFPRLMGLEKAQSYAEDLIREAKEILKDKNLFTDKLFTVADYVLLRKN